MDIDKIARIARVKLSEEEKEKLSSQLKKTLKWAEEIESEEDSEDLYSGQETNPLRDDEVKEFQDTEEIRENFPESKKDKLKVPRNL